MIRTKIIRTKIVSKEIRNSIKKGLWTKCESILPQPRMV